MATMTMTTTAVKRVTPTHSEDQVSLLYEPQSKATQRDPYALDNAFRPNCRGQMFGFMHNSGLWLVISAWYLGYYV